MPQRTMALAGIACVCAFLALGLLAAGGAQASTVPTLTLTLTKTSITVGGSTQSGGRAFDWKRLPVERDAERSESAGSPDLPGKVEAGVSAAPGR